MSLKLHFKQLNSLISYYTYVKKKCLRGDCFTIFRVCYLHFYLIMTGTANTVQTLLSTSYNYEF